MSCHEKFIWEFHNLSGTTVGEKHRSLFHLLDRNSTLSKIEVDSIISQLEPETYLEELFLVDVWIHFRSFDRLLQEFKSGNEIVISKTAKQTWFFQHIDFKSIIDDVLPAVSFSVRAKLVKRLQLDEDGGDLVFEKLLQAYGLPFASKILEKCSCKKIKETLENFPVKLTVVQLQALFEKEPMLIALYLDENIKHDDGFSAKDNPVFLYIAQKDPDMFCELKNKYEIDVRLGKRATKKFLVAKRAEVLAKPEVYNTKNLNAASLVRCLGQDFGEYFGELFKIDEGNRSILQHYAKNGRYNLYKTTYYKVLNKAYICDDFVMRMMPLEERVSNAKYFINDNGDEMNLQYYTAKECFDIVVPKLNVAESYLRGKYFDILVRCCALNQDLNVLLKVCQLIKDRFEKEWLQFLYVLIDKKNKIIEQFDEKLWKIVYEILVKLKAKEDGRWTLSYGYTVISYQYLKFLFKKNASVADAIKGCMSSMSYECFHEFPSEVEVKRTAEFQKRFLCDLVGAIPELCHKEQHNIHIFDVFIVIYIMKYNHLHPSDPIDIYNHPRLIESLKNYAIKISDGNITEYDTSFVRSNHRKAFSYAIRRKEPDAELVRLHFEKYEHVGCAETISWFLKHKPRVVETNFGYVIAQVSTVWGLNAAKIWYSLKKYRVLDEEIIQFCLSKLEDKNFHLPEDLTKPLAILMRPQDYLELAQRYKPSTTKVDLTDDDVAKFYKIQLKMALFLKTLKLPETVMPLVLEFCVGDYLGTTLSPLYGSIYNLPQNHVKYYLDQLEKIPAVSAKKHYLYLACEVLDQKSVLDYMATSTLPLLLIVILKYFIKNPNEQLWELFTTNFSKNEDTELIKIAIATKFPVKYKAKARELLWQAAADRAFLRRLFISSLTKSDIAQMNVAICASIIKTEKDDAFITNFLTYHEDPRKYDLVLKTDNGKKYFVETCMAYLESKDDDNAQLVSKLSANFDLSPLEAFEAHVLVHLTKLKGQTDIEDAVLELSRGLVNVYGRFILDTFVRVLSGCLRHLLKEERDRFKFYHGVLQKARCVEDTFLVVKLLIQDHPERADSVEFYKPILDMLCTMSNDTVQLMMNHCVTNCKAIIR